MTERYFDKRSYDQELSMLDIRVQSLNREQKILDRLEVESFDAWKARINEQTKFVNAALSASALGEEEAYKELERLQSQTETLDRNLLTKDKKGWLLSADTLKNLKEKHTTYYEPNQESKLNALDKVIEIMNKANVSSNVASALKYSHSERKWTVDLRAFSSAVQY